MISNKEETIYLFAKIKKILTILSIIVIIGCVLIALFPQIREVIINLVEIIIHRTLKDWSKWHFKLKMYSIAGIMGFCFFVSYIRYNDSILSFFEKKAKYIYIIAETGLISLFLFFSVLLAISNESLWLDEAYSLCSTRFSWTELLYVQSYDVHPPFYYLLLKFVIDIFGENIFIAKFVSILPVILTMILVTMFLNKEVSRKAGVIFLLCFIASKNIIHYSIEIRMYSWALLFVTLSFITVWYIITTDKIKWYAAFLLFAEGAAYTHIYAGLTVAIIYLMLMCYVLKFDQKKISKTFALIPFAIIFYSPWLFKIIESFIKVTNSFWIPPLTFKTIINCVIFVFRTGNLFTTSVFIILFLFIFCYFWRNSKTKMKWFAFGGLSCIVILAGMGIIISNIIRPMFLDRYLFPACGLVWLFFAITSSSIKNKQIFEILCFILLGFGIFSFSISLNEEKRENENFIMFHRYISDKITPQDIFIFIGKDKIHLPGTFSYLFPENTLSIQEIYDKQSISYKVFGGKMIGFNEINDNSKYSKYKMQTGWIITSDNESIDANFETAVINSNSELYGNFEWGWYNFSLYYTDNPKAFIREYAY